MRSITAGCDGAGLLEEWLLRHGLTMTAASKALSVSLPTVHDWLRGTKRPRCHYRRALAVWTGGAVPESSWELEHERKLVERVLPFDAARESDAAQQT